MMSTKFAYEFRRPFKPREGIFSHSSNLYDILIIFFRGRNMPDTAGILDLNDQIRTRLKLSMDGFQSMR